MILITIYLINLFIAPQLWVDMFSGLRTDYVILPIWIIAMCIKGRGRELLRFRVMDWIFVAMLIWIILSSLLNPIHDKTFSVIADYIKYFVIYRLFAASIMKMSDLRNILWIILFFVMVLVIEGIQHKLDPSGLGWAGQTLSWVDPSVIAAGGTGRTRWINIFDGPGVFCVVYAIGLPLVLILLGPPFGILTRLFGVAMLCPLLLATYYTGSRGGLLAALAVMGLYLMLRLRVSLAKLGIVCALVGLAYAAAPSHLTGVKDESHSAQHRVEMWAEGVEMVESHPLFGVGKGNFRNYTAALLAHNSAIEIMGETGVPGLFLWFAMIYFSLKGIFRYRSEPHDEFDKAYVTAMALIIVGYVVSAMFVTLEYETLYFLFGMCAAICTLLNDPIVFTRRDFKILAIASISWVLMVKVFAILYF